MPDISFDFRLFRYALAAAEYGSFRRAAAALNIQQSTVSRGVRSLEHRVGAELFERGHAGIRPTPAGDRFLEEAILGFDHLRRAMQRIGALQRGVHGQLTVAISAPFILVSELFERFCREYEGISIEVVEGTSSASWALTQQRNVDVAFVAKIREGAPRTLHLRDERMIAVLPKSHPLAGARRLTLNDLRLEKFILGAGGLGPDIEDHIVARMAKLDVEVKVQLHRVDQSSLIDMVAMGFGVTVTVGSSPRHAPAGVAVVPLAGRNVVSLYAVWMECNPNPALKGLRDIMRQSTRPNGTNGSSA
ncbi:LysR family transcriptional regulator [Mesorhizobium sp.]|uniref:LysR family transcriptional regulator n=1 Tax=Mesorhizobium sp. TaxID=1871066 RepID=UPI000FD2E5D9|nr:LysR family transcriptional regulator [Mesorhizobium sp.]RUV96485.1 LysR family transcriptional regulator [Mesorhizobium sp. M5C.F.Ca.IN.020.14.1.1]RWG50763.1 MAG: LysR family transcriptional regulator [Mesorhizobium sp.]RWH55735.1 MAG: LysR family transcriptional regulator [Mesorhizobium sp.]RWI67772.1 MAG: LysR family transcriptional regulator [Mesorhizobium sp.]RWI77728.1 MAG: LysR family transcriptional regulator [Mesorhizobium sp.]